MVMLFASYHCMSRYTWDRIPQALCHPLHIYQAVCQLRIPFPDGLVRNFVHRRADGYEYFHKSKLQHHSMNRKHFEPMVAEVLEPITRNPLPLDDVEALSVDDIMARAGFDMSPTDALISGKALLAKNSSDFQAHIISSFAATCSPFESLPAARGATKSFHWSRKLLRSTPIILFLRQKQRLLAESTFLQVNLPLKDFQEQIEAAALKYRRSSLPKQEIRNYHLTNMATTDLFRLASLSLNEKDVKDWHDVEFWRKLQGPEPLSDRLMEIQKPCLYKGKVEVDLTEVIEKDYPFVPLQKKILNLDGLDLGGYPYDVHYSDLYILTIEEPVIQDNHAPLLDVLELNEEIEVVAARLNLHFPEVNKLLPRTLSQRIRNQSMNYNDLLQKAQNSEKASDSETASFLQRLGYLGLVSVELGAAKNSISIMGSNSPVHSAVSK